MLAHLWRRWTHGERRARRQADWDRFAGPGWDERIMSLPVTDRLHEKQGRSIGRLYLRDGDDTLVVYLKRHYRLPTLRGLLAALFPGGSWSPGYEEWDNLRRLQQEGLPVPRPVMAGQFLLPGGRLQSVLAVEELTGMLALHEAIPLARRSLSDADFARWKRGLTAALAKLCRDLHGRRYFHKDLYLCHFYLAEADCARVPDAWANRLVMIDLHRLGRHRLTWAWWLAKDLGQLLYSSDVAGVTPRDRLRFWRLYQGASRRGTLGRWLRWVACARASNYHGHNRAA